MFLIHESFASGKTIVWYLKAFPDAAHASDKDTRCSVTGFIIYFCGAPISWRSRIQRSVTLSSAESECIAIGDVVKEIMYARNILRSVGIQIGLPVVVNVDNMGAIYIANNTGSSIRTKHIDINWHYIKEHAKNGVVLIRFIGTDDQDGDIMTKNVTAPIYNRHSAKLLGKPTSS